ncbi:MAG TPA: DUF2299 family protein [Xanthomonadaceae bacterium]|nr:DUF2299 family protein [Xanthomonadaceae bacterium]
MNDDKLRIDIKDWLMAEGWSVSERDHEQARWILVGEDAGKRRVQIARARFPAEQIRIQATVELAVQHRRQFAALPAQLRDSVLWDLRLRLLEMHVEFNGLGEPLERVHLNQRLYLDGLSRDALMQRVSQVKDAMICVIWLVLRHLGQEPPPTARGDFLVH